MNDLLDEELQIMKERHREGQKTLNTDFFFTPISELRMPRIQALDESASVLDAVKLMQTKKFGSVVVTGSDGKISGIVTERDILMKTVGIISDLSATPITQIMTRDPDCLHANDQIVYVMHNMHVGGYRHVPVINDDHEPISLVSIKDVLHYIFDHFPNEILNQTAQPYRGPAKLDGG